MDFAHVKGIGGPGAPHAFRLERVADAGLPMVSLWFYFPTVQSISRWHYGAPNKLKTTSN